jgi:hypothetical protein
MHDPQKVRARLQSVDQTLARLRAERNRLLARANQADRKRDTRRKILIGGAVLAAVAHEGVPAMRNHDELVTWLARQLRRAHDRAVFDLE